MFTIKKAKLYTGLLGLTVALTLFVGGCGISSGGGTTEFTTYNNSDYG